MHKIELMIKSESMYTTFCRNSEIHKLSTSVCCQARYIFVVSSFNQSFDYCILFPEGGGGGTPRKVMGVCSSFPRILFMTKICNSCYPICDLTKNGLFYCLANKDFKTHILNFFFFSFFYYLQETVICVGNKITCQRQN